MDIEERVRDQLHDLADTVPPSVHPRADLERRLAGGRKDRWRAPAVAAAAAAVVAAVAIPFSMSGGAPGAGPGVGTPPPTTATAGHAPGSERAESFVLASYGGREVVLGLDRNDNWCVTNEFDPTPGTRCEALEPWPQPEIETGLVSWVRTAEVIGAGTQDHGSLPEMLLFVTAPQVATLEVTGGSRAPVRVRLVTENPAARYFLAEFPEGHQGFGYTAKDADGNVITSAIT